MHWHFRETMNSISKEDPQQQTQHSSETWYNPQNYKMFTTEKTAVLMSTAVQILASHRKKHNGNTSTIIMHLLAVAIIS